AELTILTNQFRIANRLEGGQSNIAVAGTAWMNSPRKKRQVVPMMVALFLSVTLVLLLACANVGNLLLARAAARRHEIAVRPALGGSRGRLVRQLVVESMLLAVAAACAGLALAFVAPSAVVRYMGGTVGFSMAPDANVLLYTVGLAILSCVAFGL